MFDYCVDDLSSSSNVINVSQYIDGCFSKKKVGDLIKRRPMNVLQNI